jgi:hypothetical protein
MKETKLCSVESCEKKHWARGYCQRHYYQAKRHGHITPNEEMSKIASEASKKRKDRQVVNKDKICQVEGCGLTVKAKMYCNKHLQQMWKYGRILAPEECDRSLRLIKGRLCSVEGCGQPHSSKGYCGRHAKQMKDWGHILTDEEIAQHRHEGGLKSKQPGRRSEYRDKYRHIQQELKQRAIEYLGCICKRCGLKDPMALSVYDFHHRDMSLKEANVGNMIRKMLSWEEIKVELDKCDLVCANCHRIIHSVE